MLTVFQIGGGDMSLSNSLGELYQEFIIKEGKESIQLQ